MTHGKPIEGMCCYATMEDITEEDGNYVEYQLYPSMLWYPCMYEKSVVENLLKTQFGTFLERVKTTDCQAELRRLLKNGPPIYISDKHALPIPIPTSSSSDDKDDNDNDNDDSTCTGTTQTHICSLWYASCSENEIISSKLHGAVDGDDRDNLWTELKEFLVDEGKESGDDDDD